MRVNCAHPNCPMDIDENELNQQTAHGFTANFAGCCQYHIQWGIEQSLKKRDENVYEALDTITHNIEQIKLLKDLKERLPK